MTSAETIAKALGGRKRGSGWAVRCPAHDDRDPRRLRTTRLRDARVQQAREVNVVFVGVLETVVDDLQSPSNTACR
jgi:hypothetical protein